MKVGASGKAVRSAFRYALLGSVGASVVAGTAMAQAQSDRDQRDPRNYTVVDRPRPELDPQGLRTNGGLIVYPKLTVEEMFRDNIFFAEDPPERDADFITAVTPQLQIESDWANHALNTYAQATWYKYALNPSEDVTDYRFGIDGQLDITRDNYLFGGAEFADLHEFRGSPNDEGGIEPTVYDRSVVGAGYHHQLNRIGVTVDGQWEHFDFDDVESRTGGVPGLINNDDRDRNVFQTGVRGSYQIQPEYTAFIEGRYNKVVYMQAVDDAGIDRDSQGFAVDVGTEIELTGKLFGSIQAGYFKQYIEDPAQSDASGVDGAVDLTWLATPLTTVNTSVSRAVEETTVAGAANFVSTRVTVGADHELLRNLIVSLEGEFRRDEFTDVTRDDNVFNAGVEARYLINRHLYVSVGYNFQFRDSNVDNESYRVNSALVRIATQY